MENDMTLSKETVSPFEALLAHFNASSKSVQNAFAKYIIESRAEEMETARQKAMLRQSLNRAFEELKTEQARPIEALFL